MDLLKMVLGCALALSLVAGGAAQDYRTELSPVAPAQIPTQAPALAPTQTPALAPMQAPSAACGNVPLAARLVAFDRSRFPRDQGYFRGVLPVRGLFPAASPVPGLFIG